MGPSKPLYIKRISLAERQEQINKGLCFYCDNRRERGHKCLCKFLLLMTDEEDDSRATTAEEGDDAVESGDISILNSLIGHGSPVYIGSGETFLCESVCSNVTVHMQGKVTHDYAQQTLEFTLLNKIYSLKEDDSFRVKKISLHQVQALLDQDGIYEVYEVYSFTTEAVAAETQADGVTLEHLGLTSLLERAFGTFGMCFSVSTGTLVLCEAIKVCIWAEMLEYLGHIMRGGDGSQEGESSAGLAGACESASDLLRIDGFKWGEREASAFDSLKQQLAHDFSGSLLCEKGIKVERVVATRVPRHAQRRSRRNQENVGRTLCVILLNENEEISGRIYQAMFSVSTNYIYDSSNWWLLASLTYAHSCVGRSVHGFHYWFTGFKSTTYHPQSDGQTEVVNRGLEQYLSAMVSDRPQQWALYGRLPLSLIPYPRGQPLEKPVAIYDSRIVLQNGSLAQQVLVQWDDRSLEEATWEWTKDFNNTYPLYNLEDKVIFEARKNATPKDDGLGRRKRANRTSGWHSEFVMG
uniref:Uncharacterized protein n=1 Tax=Tanacetum cinerariifolium TaxID=118510 RepID=A0A6L2MMA8_TANCI|nr:hypothetical protein [Tanacetum cinerariifolium]